MLAPAVRPELASTMQQHKEKTPEDGQVWLKISIFLDRCGPQSGET